MDCTFCAASASTDVHKLRLSFAHVFSDVELPLTILVLLVVLQCVLTCDV